MMLETNDSYADFVLSFAKDCGLQAIVEKLDVNKETNKLDIILQPELIVKFSEKFPESSVLDLNNVVEWTLVKAFSMMKESKGILNGENKD